MQLQPPKVGDPVTPKGLASIRVPVQETGNAAQSTASYVANAHLQGGIPKPTKWMKCPGLTNKPQSAPSTPSMERVTTQHAKPG